MPLIITAYLLGVVLGLYIWGFFMLTKYLRLMRINMNLMKESLEETNEHIERLIYALRCNSTEHAKTPQITVAVPSIDYNFENKNRLWREKRKQKKLK